MKRSFTWHALIFGCTRQLIYLILALKVTIFHCITIDDDELGLRVTIYVDVFTKVRIGFVELLDGRRHSAKCVVVIVSNILHFKYTYSHVQFYVAYSIRRVALAKRLYPFRGSRCAQGD